MPASDLSTSAFLRRDGLSRGISRRRLDGPKYVRPFPGVRLASPEDVEADAAAELRQRCLWFAPRLRDGQYLSHSTALVLNDVPVPHSALRELHVSAQRPAQPPRVAGVHGHRPRPRDQRIDTVFGLPVLSPAAAWAQQLGRWTHDDLVIAADRIVTPRRRLATIEELRDEAARARRLSAVDAVLADVRLGSESPRESQLRLLMLRAGLPEPELAYEVFSDAGGFIARLDMAYPRYRVAVEYDGRQHGADVAQFQRDADRWHEVDAVGWRLMRVLNHHLADGGRVALGRIASALRDAGWRG